MGEIVIDAKSFISRVPAEEGFYEDDSNGLLISVMETPDTSSKPSARVSMDDGQSCYVGGSSPSGQQFLCPRPNQATLSVFVSGLAPTPEQTRKAGAAAAAKAAAQTERDAWAAGLFAAATANGEWDFAREAALATPGFAPTREHQHPRFAFRGQEYEFFSNTSDHPSIFSISIKKPDGDGWGTVYPEGENLEPVSRFWDAYFVFNRTQPSRLLHASPHS